MACSIMLCCLPGRPSHCHGEIGAAILPDMSNRQSDDIRFGFGDNWLDFARDLSANQIAEAEISLRRLLRRESLAGARFIDLIPTTVLNPEMRPDVHLTPDA